MVVVVLFFLFFLEGCSSISKNLWINRFEVCCLIKTDLFRNEKKIDFKDGFFQDKYVRLNFDYDILSGIKIQIKTECVNIVEIDWNKAYYIDEYGNRRDLVIYENAPVLEKTRNISYIPPYTDFEITIIPKDYVMKEKNLWEFRQMLDPDLKPDSLKGKNTQLSFSITCDDNIYDYNVYFNIVSRYNKKDR